MDTEAEELTKAYDTATMLCDDLLRIANRRSIRPVPPEGRSVSDRATIAMLRRLEKMARELATELAVIS